ncbi:hypothetical protein [Hyalangium versicolor]|uniref:hypothetical protein n=1 Tax=Hyalangium versicolor TaxID=2861190 RepID=UPI001CC95A11|nr:hypothetical protein [Hyalangium versicolor]
MLRKMTMAWVGAVVLLATPALANDKYHVYKTSRGECEIDTREHAAMKSQRGTDDCLAHYDSRLDAEKKRKDQVKAGSCKCPSGNNC